MQPLGFGYSLKKEDEPILDEDADDVGYFQFPENEKPKVEERVANEEVEESKADNNAQFPAVNVQDKVDTDALIASLMNSNNSDKSRGSMVVSQPLLFNRS